MPTDPANAEGLDLTGRVVLVIEPAAGYEGAPPDVRLRRLLKAMLRGYGWRCRSIGDREPEREEPSGT